MREEGWDLQVKAYVVVYCVERALREIYEWLASDALKAEDADLHNWFSGTLRSASSRTSCEGRSEGGPFDVLNFTSLLREGAPKADKEHRYRSLFRSDTTEGRHLVSYLRTLCTLRNDVCHGREITAEKLTMLLGNAKTVFELFRTHLGSRCPTADSPLDDFVASTRMCFVDSFRVALPATRHTEACELEFRLERCVGASSWKYVSRPLTVGTSACLLRDEPVGRIFSPKELQNARQILESPMGDRWRTHRSRALATLRKDLLAHVEASRAQCRDCSAGACWHSLASKDREYWRDRVAIDWKDDQQSEVRAVIWETARPSR